MGAKDGGTEGRVREGIKGVFEENLGLKEVWIRWRFVAWDKHVTKRVRYAGMDFEGNEKDDFGVAGSVLMRQISQKGWTI